MHFERLNSPEQYSHQFYYLKARSSKGVIWLHKGIDVWYFRIELSNKDKTIRTGSTRTLYQAAQKALSFLFKHHKRPMYLLMKELEEDQVMHILSGG